uniref:Core protein VP7 n=1 Tax=Palyam virus TaxID=40059 RepID=A0A7R7ZDY9_9REOV|nr:VP7 protein [Palyam virus]BCR31596.1 VP7 protein [Palyam virus]
MDAIAARALSVIEACTTLVDSRVSMDPGVMELLGIALNRYNAMSLRGVTMRPTTQQERNDMFFMCIDMTIAALGIQIGNISQTYRPSMATIGALATSEIPYTTSAMTRVVRITGMLNTYTPSRMYLPPYIAARDMQAPGRYYVPAGRSRSAVTSSNTIETSIQQGTIVQMGGTLAPRRGDAMMMYFIWQPIRVFSGANGVTQESGAGITVTVDGVEIAAGNIAVWDTVAPIVVTNPSNRDSMVRFEILWYTTFDRTPTLVPETYEMMNRCYSYISPQWHALRATLCTRVGLPAMHPPIFAPGDRETLMALLLYSALADACDALKPDFDMIGVAGVAPQNRAGVAQAYR